jgi:hypothetical protein
LAVYHALYIVLDISDAIIVLTSEGVVGWRVRFLRAPPGREEEEEFTY